MTALDLFNQTAVESGFNCKKDKRILEKIWSGMQEMILFNNLPPVHLGELSLDDAIKVTFLCQHFGFIIKGEAQYFNYEQKEKQKKTLQKSNEYIMYHAGRDF